MTLELRTLKYWTHRTVTWVFKYFQLAQPKCNENFQNANCLLEHITWANAFVVVYSVSDRFSYLYAQQMLDTISMLKSSPAILMANKTDLSDYARQVGTICQFVGWRQPLPETICYPMGWWCLCGQKKNDLFIFLLNFLCPWWLNRDNFKKYNSSNPKKA